MYILCILTSFLLLILIPLLIGGFSGAIYYPTKHELIKEAVKLAKICKADTIIDLGSGDGRFLFEAAKYGENATGVEIHPLLVILTKLKIFFRNSRNVSVIFKDMWSVDLSKYDVIFIFLYPSKMKKLEEKIKKEAKKGTRIVSYAFKFPKLKYDKKTKSGLYLYKIE